MTGENWDMKTFKLKGLQIVADEKKDIAPQKIPLIDGLIINREDEIGWLIEAFIESSHKTYFKELEDTDELMIKVKITREDNDPAFFITKVIGINDISDERMNVIFQCDLVYHRKSRIEELLEDIFDQGYQGSSLLKKFNESIYNFKN